MSCLKRIGLVCALTANSFWGLTACLQHNERPGTGDGSVLASIGGINEKDKDRAFTYELVCGAVRVAGQGKADQDFVRFPGDKLKDGSECALEVRLPVADAEKLEFDWFGKSNGKDDVGLFYGSDVQKIAGSKLSLTLYSLASAQVDNAFTVQVNVKFELAAGEAIPPEDKTSATLVCGDDLSQGGTYKKEAGGSDATLSFTLETKKFSGKTCTAVKVSVDNAAKFSADTPDVKLDGAKKKDVKVFPDANDATKRYALKGIAVGGGDVDTTTTGGGACLSYENNVCKDARKSTDLVGDLPFETNVVLARVKGKIGDQGEAKTFLVGAGSGVQGLKNKSFNVSDLNDALQPATEASFTFFQDAGDEKILGTSYDNAYAAGNALTKVALADLKDFKVLHIEKIFVHGMHKVTETNGVAAPLRWMTFVKATKDAIVSEFVVTGKDAGFLSTAAPLTVDAKAVYFDFAKLAAEMAVAPGSDKWKVYGLKDGAMAAADCALGKTSYLDGLSAANQDTLKDFALGTCEIGQAKFDQALATGFEIKAEHFVWEWFVPTK